MSEPKPITEAREKIAAWLKANDIDPNIVPERDNKIDVGVLGLRVTTDIYVLDKDGNKQLDPNGHDALRERITYPLKVRPPHDLKDLLLLVQENRIKGRLP